MLQEQFFTALHQQFLLPVLRMHDTQRCLNFCYILHQHGFEILEITLTTPDALTLIETLSKAGHTVGAGTVLTLQQAYQAVTAGAQFLVSPGLSLEIARFAQSAQIPYLPGVYTASEVLQALELGCTRLKFFPARPVGPEYLKHLAAPFPEVKWLPTGGILLDEIPAWLDLPLLAIGQGSQFVSATALQQQDWSHISAELVQIRQRLRHWQGTFV